MTAALLPEGYRRRSFDTTPSTSAEAFAAARAGEDGGIWITAGEQTAGRGRHGRRWTTGRGNLAASLLLIDPAPAEVVATVSFVGAVALHRAAAEVTGVASSQRLAVKWPNDVLLDRRKVAGILVEGERLADGRLAVAIGFGVNCVSHPDIVGQQAATSFAAAGLTVAAEALFVTLAARLAEEIARWEHGRAFAVIRAAWLDRAAGVGAPIAVNMTDRAVDGVFETLDESGRLIVRRTDGTRTAVSAGDVFFATAAG